MGIDLSLKMIILTFTNRSLGHKFDTIVPYTLYQFTYRVEGVDSREEDELSACSALQCSGACSGHRFEESWKILFLLYSDVTWPKKWGLVVVVLYQEDTVALRRLLQRCLVLIPTLSSVSCQPWLGNVYIVLLLRVTVCSMLGYRTLKLRNMV